MVGCEVSNDVYMFKVKNNVNLKGMVIERIRAEVMMLFVVNKVHMTSGIY